MKTLRNLKKELKGTSIEKSIKAIKDFYNALEKDLKAFHKKYGIKCPSSCGNCCARFLPDITKLESIYLASWIYVSQNKEEIIKRLENAKEKKEGPCPLYDESSSFHCLCYDARPLICRLFAESCFPGKNGEKKFSRCHLNPEFTGPSEILDEKAPLMGTYGEKLLNLEDNDSFTEFLAKRVLKDLDLISYYEMLKKLP